MIHSFSIAFNMELRFAAFKTFFIFIASFLAKGCNAEFDYGDALGKGILFYEGQRSGPLPSSQRVTWRSDSGLQDGKSVGVDLRGGYYDAGDNVKFGLPMAFTITMLSWSVIEYRNQLESSGQLQHALEAIKWGTDYLMKAHPEPNVLWGEVGDGNTDHNCWQRPEDMTTSRQAYKIDANNPGSDLAGETAAAMAAASLALKSQTDYSNLLLAHSRQLFSFADRYRGKYVNSIQIAQKYYDSKSGYADELLWAAMWLHEATGEAQYLKYVADNAGPLGGTGWAITEFSWDVKYAGVQVLASKVLMEGRGGAYTPVLQDYQSKAQYFLCACLQKNNGPQVRRTPGGLMYIRSWNNMQYVTSGSFLMTVYSDYLTNSGQNLKCGAGAVNPSELFSFAKSQIDYILGDNPRATSYMVGYGSNFPQQIHHRASSIVSIKVDPSFVSCRGGYQTWYSRRQADPNVLVGALVGGPDQNDNFGDERDNWEQTEPATYNNGPLVGVLARLHGGGSTADPSASPMKTVATPSAVVHKSGEVAVSQKVASSWIYRGQTYYKYAVTVINNSRKKLKQLKLSIDELKGPVWGVSRIDGSSNSYTFPSWMQSLAPGASFDFVYIHASSQATVSVSDYLLN